MADGYHNFGCASEDEYRASLDIPRSTWFKYIRIGEALQVLSFDDLRQISTGNAEILIQVQPELWADYPWVEEAKRLDSSTLAMRVTERNRQAGSTREPLTYYRARVPFLAKDAIEEMVEAFRQKNCLNTAGEALEMLIADQYDRPNLIDTIYRVKLVLNDAIQELGRENVPNDRRLFYVERLGQAYQALNETHRKEAQTPEYKQDFEDLLNNRGRYAEEAHGEGNAEEVYEEFATAGSEATR